MISVKNGPQPLRRRLSLLTAECDRVERALDRVRAELKAAQVAVEQAQLRCREDAAARVAACERYEEVCGYDAVVDLDRMNLLVREVHRSADALAGSRRREFQARETRDRLQQSCELMRTQVSGFRQAAEQTKDDLRGHQVRQRERRIEELVLQRWREA